MAYIDMDLNIEHLSVPKPLVQALRAIDTLLPGQVLKVTTCEARAIGNFERMCQTLGHKLLEIVSWDGEYTLLVEKH